MFEFTFKMFSEGYATLPAQGMASIPGHLAARLPAHLVGGVVGDRLLQRDPRLGQPLGREFQDLHTQLLTTDASTEKDGDCLGPDKPGTGGGLRGSGSVTIYPLNFSKP